MRAAIALVLGALTAVAIGCGGSSGGTIPKASTGPIKDHLDSVHAAVDDEDCTQVPVRIKRLNSDITNLAAKDVPDELLRNLRQGVAKLSSTASKDCAPSTTTESVPADTTPTETQTETVPTDTVQTQTDQQDTTSTDTGTTDTGTTEPPTDTTGDGTGGASPTGEGGFAP